LTPESVHVLVLCKIIAAGGQTLNDDFFKTKLAVLEEAVPQYSAAPISNEIRNELDNTDDALWSAELGDTGSAGFLVRRTGASSEYFIQVSDTMFPCLWLTAPSPYPRPTALLPCWAASSFPTWSDATRRASS